MKKNILSYIYILLFLISLILSYLGTRVAGYEVYQPLNSTEVSMIEPVRVVQVNEDVREFYFELENNSPLTQTLEFYTNHQRVDAYLDGELVYSLIGGNSIWGRTTGSKFNFISCPNEAKELKLVIEAIYPAVRTHDFEFFYGLENVIYANMLKNSIWGLLVSVLIIFIGFFLVAYWCVMHKKALINPGLLHLGVFTIIFGLWIMTETDFMTLIAVDRAVQSFIAYLLLMLVMMPFVLYVNYFFEVENKKVVYTMCAMSIANTIICLTLHMTGIMEFKQTVFFIHILIAVGLGYMFVCLVGRFLKRGFDAKVRTNAIGIVLFVGTVGIDLYGYYTKARSTDVVGRIGFMFYILLLGIDNASESIRQINIGRKAELYREMAITDLLTGLYNRNAFEAWENENSDFSDMMLVTFDLNDLKGCNDTFGHAAGDKYIADSAAMIRRVFGRIGTCYRIGGDEFCTVVKNASRINIEGYLERFRRLQKEYNAYSKEVKIQVACGYAVFNEQDKNIENTRSRADASMYKNKKTLKES